MSSNPVRDLPMSPGQPAPRAPAPAGRRQPDPRGDLRGDRRAQGDPVHEGHARSARLRLLGAHGRGAAVARTRRSRQSTSCPTRASARSCRRSRTGRRSRSCSSTASCSAAATSSPRCTSRESSRRRWCSVPPRMPRRGRHRQHPLPAARAGRPRRHPPGQPVRRLERRTGARARHATSFDAFYERLRTTPSCRAPHSRRSATSSPCGSRCSSAGHDVVSIHLAGGISGTCEAARQAHALLSERGLGERVEVLDSESGCGGAGLLVLAACAAARAGRGQGRRRGARARDAQGAENLVLPGHARVPAPRRAHRQGPGLARRHAEDQADPLAGVRDHARGASAHRRPRVRAHGRLRRSSSTTRRRRLGRPAHPGARPGRAADRALPRDLRHRAGLHLRGRPGDRHLHRARPDRRRRRPARAS